MNYHVKKLSLPNSGLNIELRKSGVKDYELIINNRSSFYREEDLVKLFEFLGETIIELKLDKYLSFGRENKGE
jgi:hypothetical protein